MTTQNGPQVTNAAQFPASFDLLPKIAGVLGAIVAFILASWGLDFWFVLHAAYDNYLTVATVFCGIAAPVGALLAYWALQFTTNNNGHETTKPRKWSRRMLGIWLALAPAGHWMASATIFLYASRYSPPGGKILAIAFGLVHILLLALCIYGGVSWMRGAKNQHRTLKVYFAVLILCLVVQVLAKLVPVAISPLLFWGAILGVISAVLFAIQFFTTRNDGNVQRSNQVLKFSPGGLAKTELTDVSTAEATGFLLGTLFVLAYLLTSQFDTRPTSPLTHSLLLVLSVSYLTAAVFFERRRDIARMLFRFVGPILLTVAVLILVLLHNHDETDPILIVTVVMIPAILLSAYAAQGPFRKAPNCID